MALPAGFAGWQVQPKLPGSAAETEIELFSFLGWSARILPGQAVLSFQFLMTTHAPPRALTWSQSLSASAKLSEPTLTA
jgi:hypothetical protein